MVETLKSISREIHLLLNIPFEYPNKIDFVRIRKDNLIKLRNAIKNLGKN